MGMVKQRHFPAVALYYAKIKAFYDLSIPDASYYEKKNGNR